MISLFEFFVKNTITVITPLKVNRNMSISLHVWLVRTKGRMEKAGIWNPEPERETETEPEPELKLRPG